MKPSGIIKVLEKAFAKGYSFKPAKDNDKTIMIKSTS
jgi:hypothetical protein